MSDQANCTLYSPRRFNKRSRQRFAANRTAELVRHLGHMPSYPERIIIFESDCGRVGPRRLDAKLDAGNELSGHDIRGRQAAENRLRLDLQALGLKRTASPPQNLVDYSREKAIASASEAAA